MSASRVGEEGFAQTVRFGSGFIPSVEDLAGGTGGDGEVELRMTRACLVP